MSLQHARGIALASLCAAVLGVGGSAPVAGREPQHDLETPLLFRQLVDCRAIADAAARLACYDERVSELDTATKSKNLVVADRKEIRQVRKGLFGFSLPKIGGLFGGGGDDADDVKRIETTVTSVSTTRSGELRLVFAEGGTWEQIDVRSFVLRPRPGLKAEITKGSFGSYYVSVDGQPGIKMRRVE